MEPGQRPSRALKYELAGTGVQRALAGDGSRRAGRVVLVVDDDAAMTRLIGGVLGTIGVTTLSAYDGLQGMLVAQKQLPDLILVDLHMPAGGGIKLLEKLRASARTAETPVLAFTADTSPDLPARVAALGAQGFLRKPIDPVLLLQAVQPLLREPSASPDPAPKG